MFNLSKMSVEGNVIYLADGTPLYLGKGDFETGVQITAKDSTGKVIPLPTQTYKLKDGTYIKVINDPNSNTSTIDEIIDPIVDVPVPDPVVNNPTMDHGGHRHGLIGGIYPDLVFSNEQILEIVYKKEHTDGGELEGKSVVDTEKSQNEGQSDPSTEGFKKNNENNMDDVKKVLDDIVARLQALEQKVGEHDQTIASLSSKTPTDDEKQKAQTEQENMKKEINTLMSKATFAKEIISLPNPNDGVVLENKLIFRNKESEYFGNKVKGEVTFVNTK